MRRWGVKFNAHNSPQVKHPENVENRTVQNGVVSSQGDEVLEAGQRISVLNIELQLKQQEIFDLRKELENFSRQVERKTKEKDDQITELKSEIANLKKRETTIDEGIVINRNKLGTSSPSINVKISPIKHDENVLQLDQDKKIALLEEKVSQLERSEFIDW